MHGSQRFVRPVFPFKAGSTEWGRLLHKVLLGVLIPPQSNGGGLAYMPNLPYYSRRDVESHECPTLTLCLVRDPFARMLSSYLDKAPGPKFKPKLLPPGMTRNSSFARFVQLAVLHRKQAPLLALQHYAPILPTYPLCSLQSTRLLRIEAIDEWYASLVTELGWQSAARDRMARRRRLLLCTSRSQLHHSDRPLRLCTDGRPKKSVLCPNHQVKEQAADTKLRDYYTPQLAALVAAYAKADLEALNYTVLTFDGHGQSSDHRPL